MMPARNKPMASSDVPTGRRMNGAQMFMTGESRIPKADDRNPKAEDRKKAETRRPNRLPVGLEPRQFQKQKLNSYTIPGHRSPGAAWKRPLSGFGIRPSFGLRDSAFGFGGVLLDRKSTRLNSSH